MLTWIAIVVLLAGIVLVVIGLHGRRIDDHPVCRACEFDLVGLGLGGAQSDDPVCPECGVNLRLSGAIRHGQRRRNTRSISTGVVLLAISLAFVALVIQPGAVGPWLQSRLPTGWVMAQANLGSGAAAGELADRWANNKLSRSEIGRAGEIAVSALERSATVRAGWTDLLVATLRTGTLTPEQQRRFILAVVDFDTRFRSRVYPGEPIWYQFTRTAIGDDELLGRVGATTFRFDAVSVSVGPIRKDLTGTSSTTWIRSGESFGRGTWGSSVTQHPSLEPGTYRASYICMVSIDGVSTRMEHTQVVEVVPPETPADSLITKETDAEIGAALAASIELIPPEVAPMPPHPGEARIRVRLRARGLPVPIAGDVLWRIEGIETTVGDFVMMPSQTDSQSTTVTVSHDLPMDFPPPEVTHVEVILRPRVGVALTRSLADRIWGDEFVFENVPINRVEAAALSAWDGSTPGIPPRRSPLSPP